MTHRLWTLQFVAVQLLLVVVCLAVSDVEIDDVVSLIDVYYINLSRRPDRDRHMRSELEHHHLVAPDFRVHRFEAVDGLTHEFTPEEAALFATFDANFNSENAALLKCNSLSHMGVWRQVLESGVSHAVVFQDDVQLSEGFKEGLMQVIAHNPSNALVTWLGLNGYASGSVSRSAPMNQDKYDPNQVSSLLPNTNGVIGMCRPMLISTNSLAYLLTRRGAEVLLEEFGNNQGWTHHTDHAMVGFLDRLGVSYISRRILATTHDDNFFGSDIFFDKQAELASQHAEAMVRTALEFARLATNAAISAAATKHDDPNIASPKKEKWLQGLNVRCEEMKCLFSDCPVPFVTQCFLTWNHIDASECIVDDDGTCRDKDDDTMVVDESGVRRHAGRKKLSMGAAASDISPKLAAEAIPAWWTLEAWASGNYQAHYYPRPRFAQGDAVEINKSTESAPHWESAVIASVGYRDPSWPEGTTVTYIVLHEDGRMLTVVIDHATKIRLAMGTNHEDMRR